MRVVPRAVGKLTVSEMLTPRVAVVTVQVLVMPRTVSDPLASDAQAVPRSFSMRDCAIAAASVWCDALPMRRVTVAISGTAPKDTIRFDARGIAIGLTASETIKFINLTAVDSVCVTRVGKVTRGGCPS